MSIERCADCGQSLGSHVQENLFGKPKQCIECLTKARTRMMLTGLPDPDGPGWGQLREREQEFLESVREQFARKKILSEKQFQWLEAIWNKG